MKILEGFTVSNELRTVVGLQEGYWVHKYVVLLIH